MVAADCLDDGLRDLNREAGASSGRAAVKVGALVAGGCEELVQDVTVRGVDLDAVQARLDGVARRGDEVLDDPGDLGGLQSAGVGCGTLPVAVTIWPGAASALGATDSRPFLLSG